MKVQSKLFLWMAVFFFAMSGVYAFATMTSDRHIEPIGLTVFILTGLMCAMIFGYMAVTTRHMDDHPEDDRDGEIVQGAGQLGFFPPTSIWPFWCALVLAVMLLGPVFGWWITILGGALGVWAVCGWCYEFYVGEYRH
jgi:hypothetical protein